MQNHSLFDDVFEDSGFRYLSDIHYSKDYETISRVVSGLNANKYSLEEWNSLIEYTTGQDVSFSTIDEASHYLIDLPTKANKN